MHDLEILIHTYLEYCRYQKGLNEKTLQAYKIDLLQYHSYYSGCPIPEVLSRNNLIHYITHLHKNYKPRSSKRKIASLKAFCAYLQYEEIFPENPFERIKTKFQEPLLLPRTIPFVNIETLLITAYAEAKHHADTNHYHTCLRDIAVLELLFATGIRVSELCGLNQMDIDLDRGVVKIYGKGARERIVQIGHAEVLAALIRYRDAFTQDIESGGAFFVNRVHHRLSEQSVRLMINKYTEKASLPLHITPHMFRHIYVKRMTKNILQ
ncbi:tyrosine-type recombinase/integrase [Methanorbis rubei]